MGHWEIVVPEATTNLIINPSLETNATGYTWGANAQGAGFGRSSDASRWGAYSAEAVCTGAGNRFVRAADFTRGANDDITISVWAQSDSGTSQLLLRLWEAAGGGGDLVDSATYQVTTTWQRLELTVADATMDAWNAGGVSLQLWVINDADTGVAKTWYVDGFQAEALDHVTTYCDGTQPGCEWNGTAHASTSTRSALSRAGGRVYDLTDDFSMNVTRHVMSGVAPITQHHNNYSQIPGGEVTGYKVNSRVLTLSGFVYDRDGWSGFHDLMQTLFGQMSPDAVPENQPVLLRYPEASVTKEIAGVYEGGLEGSWDARRCAEERFAIRFLCADPFWYEVGESAAHLDIEDTPTLHHVTARLRSTGQWDDLGLANNPTTNGTIFTILYATDGYVYVGGNFTGMDAVAGRDYVARYDRAAGTWETVGGAGDFNSIVYKLIEGPDGTIYAGGQFTNVAGGGNADYLVQWTGAAWSAVGIPVAGTAAITYVHDLAFDSQGILYIGGDFDDWANIAAADGFVSWTGAAYAAVGAPAITGVGNLCMAIAIDSQDNIYIGGTFANLGGDADADNLGVWDGTAWSSVGGVQPNAVVRDLAITDQDLLYICGNFTDLAGIAEADYIAQYDGNAYAALSSGVNNLVYVVHITPDGNLLLSGNFTTAGGISTTDRVAGWNGSTFYHIDGAFAAGVPQAIETGPVDPVLASNYDLWMGTSASGAARVAGSIDVTNGGTRNAFPIIVIERTGAGTALVKTVRNETLGLILWLDYSLLAGETLTIDLRPTRKSITSSFFGARADALLKGSDFGTFALRPGSNQITAFVDVAGPTITAHMVYRDTYWSIS